MSGNGHDPEKAKEVLTPEELKKARLDRYMKEPETFVELEDVVCMVVKNKTSSLGISVFIGNVQRSLLNQGQMELSHVANKIRLKMDIESEMKHPKIVPGKGSMLNFMRRK